MPAIHGIPPSATSDQLKTFGAGAASAGSVALFHVIGLTPEARIQDPFGGVSPDEVVTVTRAELDGMASRISTAAPGEKVDMVTLGCPLLSVEELKGVAAKMPARRVRKDMHFWMYLAGERRTSWGLV